ncbi:MAG: hypothetical protein Q7T11_05550 [Deltaproteobacteria bacterium]|nr:hypothetical protein [Deltaproteobacteria bacterium]
MAITNQSALSEVPVENYTPASGEPLECSQPSVAPPLDVYDSEPVPSLPTQAPSQRDGITIGNTFYSYQSFREAGEATLEFTPKAVLGAGALVFAGPAVIGAKSLAGLSALAALALTDCSQNTCGGDAATETKVIFKDPSIGAEEQIQIISFLKQWESPLRAMNPTLFNNFCGWIIETPEAIKKQNNDKNTAAYYETVSSTIHADRTLFGLSHEFCHYVSDQAAENLGHRASETPTWQEMACTRDDIPLSHCLSGIDGHGNPAEENFADSCATIVDNPPGGVIRNTEEPHRLNQALFISNVLGTPETAINRALESTAPAVEIPLQDLQSLPLFADPARKFGFTKLSDGRWAYPSGPREIIIRKLSDAGELEGETVSLPQEFDENRSYSIAMDGETIALKQGNAIYVRPPSGPWALLSQNDILAQTGSIIFVDSQPVVLGPNGSFLVFKDKIVEQPYPPNIKKRLEEASGKDVFVPTETKTFWWIPDSGKNASNLKSYLYRLELNGDQLVFQTEIETRASPKFFPPLHYRGHWILPIRVPSDELMDPFKEFKNMFLGPVHYLQLDHGGALITPLKPFLRDDPNREELVGPESSLLTLTRLHVSGDRIVGETNVGGELISFTLGPLPEGE